MLNDHIRLRPYTDRIGSALDDCKLIAAGFLSSIDQFDTIRNRSLSAMDDESSIIKKRSPSGVTS